MLRWIAHIDMDAFFVEVERRLDPSLAGKPIIVGGDPDGRGVVAACSYETRRFGVRSAMPLRRAKQLCPDALFLRGHPQAYADYSRRVRALLQSYTPLVEMASIDEAYLDLTGTERLHGPPPEAVGRILHRIRSEIGLPASAGLAANKLVAKVACDTAKPSGFCVVPHGTEAAFLASLPMRQLPGIGPKLEAQLSRYGIATIGDIVALGESTLQTLFGPGGSDLYYRCQGMDDSPVQLAYEARSIGHETTFEQDTGHRPTLERTLSYLAERVARRLRRHRLRARCVTLKLRYGDFQTVTRRMTLAEPTCDDREIYAAARCLLDRAWTRRAWLRLLGISASGLTDAQWQMDLWAGETEEARAALAAAIDRIKGRYGFDAILRARSFHGDGGAAKKEMPSG
ncbi:MAG: DNA polymerase IV [Candidatus Sumerlaeia bacterium]|nr:DNA polymerase IV [Candidatus Sumerlaeia bacterium]